MKVSDRDEMDGFPAPRRFDTTRWSLVVAAREGDTKQRREALTAVCEAYWYPLYAFIRHKGYTADDALDLVQGFFERLLEKGDLSSVERSKGRLRSFLMASCTHYLANRLDHDHARKRGGGRGIVSIDGTTADVRYCREPSHEMTAERLFEQKWATALLAMVISRLENEMNRAGKARQFAILRPALSGRAERGAFPQIAAEFRGDARWQARAQGHRLRHRQGDRAKAHGGVVVHRARHDSGHTRVHVAGAG